MQKVMVFGTFDGLHPGHLFVMTEAQKRGQVTVIVARDENVQTIKGKLPAMREQERVLALKKQFPALTVLLGDPKNFLHPVQALKPDLILLGYDQLLPPGVLEADLQCPIERLPSFHPDRYKSSLLSKQKRGIMSR